MKINGEPVELVTDFSELRAGMIVWVVECERCPSTKDRGMIVRIVHGSSEHPDGSMTEDDVVWRFLPPCPGGTNSIAAEDVDEEVVYRVVNPLDAQTTARKREAVRG